MATYTLVPLPRIGITPEAGMLIYTYSAGGASAAATYTDSVGSGTNTNPVQADGNGLFPAIYLPLGTSYKFIATHAVTNALPPDPVSNIGVIIWTQDGIASVPSSSPAVDLVGTAGESLVANANVYLSDGSGGKQASLWYNADPANAYSSVKLTVGFTTLAIASGMTGLIRISGGLGGFSALTPGAVYYTSTGGAITTTPPVLARFVGQADTTTSIVVAANPPIVSGMNNGVNDFRLTLTSVTPVTRTDVLAATTLYCTPAGNGNRLGLADALGIPASYASAQFSIAIPATTNTNYDVFAYANNGQPALELNVWRNQGQAITGATNATPIVITANAHGLSNGDEAYVDSVFGNTAANGTWIVANVAANTFELVGSVGNGGYTAATGFFNARASTGLLTLLITGFYSKTGDLTRRYLGSVRTTGVSGQTEDSTLKRLVYNYYNRVARTLQVFETTASWAYTTATVRQANGSTANQVAVLIGMADAPIDLVLSVPVVQTTGGTLVSAGIGQDSTTTYAAGQSQTLNQSGIVVARLVKIPAPGFHNFMWNEWSTAAGATTWYGITAGAGSTITSGISGLTQG